MAVVPLEAVHAVHPKTKQAFLLPFGKNSFYIPESAVVSLPKRSNKVADGQALGIALATKAPENWRPFCDPDCLMQIRGNEGTSVYTTFEVEGHPDEVRYLRHIGYQIAEKVFKEWSKKVAQQIKAVENGADVAKNPHGRIDPKDYNDRQRIRYDVLKWRKDADCPSRAQLHPELNQWTPANKDGTDQVKSCKIDPPSKARPKGSSNDKRAGGGTGGGTGDKRKRGAADEDDWSMVCSPDDDVQWRKCFMVGPKGSYKIDEINGKIHITQYKHSCADKEGERSQARLDAEDEAEDENDI